mgnify:CR=1 FL=1
MFVCAESLGVITFTGDDARTFLQGQATPDFRKMSMGDVAFGAFCSPKGRVIANGWFQATQDGYRFVLARDLVDLLVKRLRLYVLRAKVVITDESDADPLFLIVREYGATSPETIQEDPLAIESLNWQFRHSDGLHIAAGKNGVGTIAPLRGEMFTLSLIREGVPLVTSLTTDLYIPQMLSMERWGGLSFDKGCYTGQEVVTRTQFLGRVKRALYRFTSESANHLHPRVDIYQRTGDGEPFGSTFMTAAFPNGGVVGLAVIKETDADEMKAFADAYPIELERIAPETRD